MEKAGGGPILAITSMSGDNKNKRVASYGSSKAATNHLIRNIAFDLRPRNIGSVAVSAGWQVRPMDFDRPKMIEALRRVVRRMHYPLQVMLVCVRWYAAYPLSFRQIEEMMAERGVFVDHSTLHRWSIKMLPVLAAALRRRKRAVGTSWRMDETYVKVAGQWKYLYRAVDKSGDTINFLLRAKRDHAA